jgi:RHS repeat-associated protein
MMMSFAVPVAVDGYGNPVGNDFNDFLVDYLGGVGSITFDNYFNLRAHNPGSRMEIDYTHDIIRTETDIERDEYGADIKRTEKESDGLENLLKETEIGPYDERYEKVMSYDEEGRMIALTDPDAETFLGEKVIHGTAVACYDKTWLVFYDDLGRKKKVIYPATRQGVVDVKEISYNDMENTVTTTYPEARRTCERFDWNGNIIEAVNYGDENTGYDESITYSFGYDELNRKVTFTDGGRLITTYRYDERDLLEEQHYGVESGSDFMTYNDLGQLVKKRDRKGQEITFFYDEIGRNTRIDHFRVDNSQPVFDHSVSITYDNRGNAVRIENPNLIEHYLYDCANRVITLERFLKDEETRNEIALRLHTSDWCNDPGNQVFSFHYTYNDVGMVTSMTYPDGQVHSFEYDPVLGWLKKIRDNDDDFVSRFEYNRSGVVTRMEYANNTFQTWEFDNRKRIKHIYIGDMYGNAKSDLAYTLNGAGDILSINDNEYAYDGFDRLTSAKTMIPGMMDRRKLVLAHFGAYENEEPAVADFEEHSFNEQADLDDDGRISGTDLIEASMTSEKETYDSESFVYDKSGNRVKLVQNGTTHLYTCGIRNRLEKIEVEEEESFKKRLFAEYTYDANGNTVNRKIYHKDGTIKEETVFSYDTMNRVLGTETFGTSGQNITTYYYDNAGNRFIKKGSSGTTIYLRHGQIAVAMDIELPAEGTDAYNEYAGKVNRYVLSGDLLAGRITDKTNHDGNSETKKHYYHLDHLNSTKCVTDENAAITVLYEYRAFGEQLKRLDEAGNETGDRAKYSFGGKELDDATNLYYFNARYYDATLGRFINVDPVQDGTNWYVYGQNNPLSITDPTGLRRRYNVRIHRIKKIKRPFRKMRIKRGIIKQLKKDMGKSYAKSFYKKYGKSLSYNRIKAKYNVNQKQYNQTMYYIDNLELDRDFSWGKTRGKNDRILREKGYNPRIRIDGYSQDTRFHHIEQGNKCVIELPKNIHEKIKKEKGKRLTYRPYFNAFRKEFNRQRLDL